MVLAKKFGYITIVSVIPGSPADKAGLTTGDIIESIKGIATRDMPLAYAKLLLQGAAGSTIDLSVLRRKPEPQKLTLTRAVVAYPPVESKMLPDKIGYIKVAALDRRQDEGSCHRRRQLCRKKARRSCCSTCASAPRAIREDGIDLANLFLDKGLITYVRRARNLRAKTYDADAKKDITSLPLVVLTNRGTASGRRSRRRRPAGR